MALVDRVIPLSDLLMGAAYADADFKDREEAKVRGLLEEVSGGELSIEVETHLAGFDPKTLDVAAAAAHFKGDPEDDRKRVLFLVAAINEADDEIDFAEDEYLRTVGKALGLSAESLAGMTIDLEEEETKVELKQAFAKVKKGPPPPPVPGKKSVDDSFDVDV